MTLEAKNLEFYSTIAIIVTGPIMSIFFHISSTYTNPVMNEYFFANIQIKTTLGHAKDF